MNDPERLGICPRCGARLEDLSQRCPACGADVSSQSQMPTVAALGTRRAADRAGTVGRVHDASSGREGFALGQVVAGRYRIVGLLGRGGMGEVYRADDLELEQPVALKFLPRSLAGMPQALELFRAEVRNARQIAHPNVCRVYDIGEADGQPFLTMEYVDGEDLATLLHRIGSLPQTKAHEVAAQLCAGLAAAHDKGVLHRDLKPSNVMIDGEGRVRLTDFGLAVRTDANAAEFAGTPAYMAPEQFTGAPLTVRSDLYALGLILYEVYSGRRPFDATSVTQWKSQHTDSVPMPPSQRDVVLDGAVERAILRCLEKDPLRRPASARQLAAALPGGDPIAAAIAAGETPSPEMVADSGGEGALTPRKAWTLAVGVLVAIATIAALGPYASDLGLGRLSMSPAMLRDRAEGWLDRFGYGRDVIDRDSWVERVYSPMLYIAQHVPSTRWRARWRMGPPIVVTLRQSPRWMIAREQLGALGDDDPPFDVSDMAMVRVDAAGRLRYLRVVPPQVDSALVTAPFDWGELFTAAGLDRMRFHPARPTWVPPDGGDARAEWVGDVPELPGIPLRISAAAFGGRPVYFEILGPWSRPGRMERPQTTMTQRIAAYTAGLVTLVSAVFAVFLVRRNRRLGRFDTKGAVRLGTLLFGLTLLRWLAGAHHVPAFDLEGASLMSACAWSLLLAASAVMLYLAIEPYVRRRMPDLMIGWARALEGRLRDPRVGHDVLTGALLGCASALLLHLSNALPTWIPILGQTTVPPNAQFLQGGAPMVAALALDASNALIAALTLLFILFLFRVTLKREWFALAAMMLVFSLGQLGGENVGLETPFALLQGALVTWTIGRVGLLGGAAMVMFRQVLGSVPLPLDVSAPYMPTTLIVLASMLALAAYALRISVGTRRLLSIEAFEH